MKENLFQSPETMTVGQIAKAAGVHHTTVYRRALNLFPDRFVNGVKTEFTEEESYAILRKIGKKEFLVPLREVKFDKVLSEGMKESHNKRLGIKKEPLQNAKETTLTPMQNAKVKEILAMIQETDKKIIIKFNINLNV